MSTRPVPGPSLADLDEALTLAAFIVLRHGDAYAPIMERLEREIEEAKRQAPSSDRARRILAAIPGNPALISSVA